MPMAEPTAQMTAPEHGAPVGRGLIAAVAAAVLLVIARSLVFAIYEQSYFDSDQAIIGLMAKHLSEGRAFPLFMYGQPYMLAVESWLAVPIFWIAGPTVAALRALLILINCAIVVLLMVGLHRWGRLRPMEALVATLFFSLAPPLTAAQLVEAAGGNIEPFLYVLLAWLVRHRPFWLGTLLAIGFLSREFTIYAVPVLLMVEAADGTLFRADGLRRWLFTAIAFLVVWDGVLALRSYADLRGPGSRGVFDGGFASAQVGNIVTRARFTPAELPERALTIGRTLFPQLLGGTRVVDSVATQGRDWMAWVLGAGLVAGVLRIAQLTTRPARIRASVFPWYILGVGVVAAIGYLVTRPATVVTPRYMLLGLFVPVGLTAVWLAVEPRVWVRRALIGATIVWAGAAGLDHARLAARYLRGDVPNDIRVLADGLVAREVRVAEATYWRAYKLTFLTRERVKVASSDFVRIDEYQRLAQAQPHLVRIQEQPCPGGEHVALWFLCR